MNAAAAIAAAVAAVVLGLFALTAIGLGYVARDVREQRRTWLQAAAAKQSHEAHMAALEEKRHRRDNPDKRAHERAAELLEEAHKIEMATGENFRYRSHWLRDAATRELLK